MGLAGQFRAFFDERFDTGVAEKFVIKQATKRLPPRTGWLHVFGSLSLLRVQPFKVCGNLGNHPQTDTLYN